MRRTTAFSVATGTALGCTVLATALTLGVAGTTSGQASVESSGPVGAELASQLEAEADPLRVLAAERAVAARKAASAAEFAAGVGAERSGALERATRAAERVTLEKAAAAKAAADAAAAAAAEAAVEAAAEAEAARVASASPRELGQILAAERGWAGGQWSCLDSLWQRESNWNPTARNASSGAFGIPQALPGSKMATAGADWATNPATQISWGLTYIADRYGSPCGAWAHSQSHNWY